MPELPEVETIVRCLHPKLNGGAILAVLHLRQDIVSPKSFDLTAHLPSRQILQIYRRAKRIVFRLDNNNQFYIHLGMSGRLTLESPSQPIRPHTHLILRFEAGELRFVDPRRFGGIFWLGQTQSPDDGLGPEPLTLRPTLLAKSLSKTNRNIKNALLDQSLIAGLGNIYVDESLFTARIHPLTAANRLTQSQIAALNRAIKQVLRGALRHRGSTLRDYRDADGNEGAFQKLHRVYDRKGKPCTVCKTPIERIVIGGRSTHFCPKCQTRSRKTPTK